MFELSQNKHLDQSIRFADMTVSQLVSNSGRRNRGVLQAGFWVLHASAMPAVLIELDFICNPTSERFMNSKDGVKKMARSIANAILLYFNQDSKVEQPETPTPEPAPLPEPMPAPGITQPEEVKQPAQTEDTVKIEKPETPKVNNSITYRIQILAAAKFLPFTSREFKGLSGIEEYLQGGLHKYTVGGDFNSEAEAEKYAAEIVRSKFPQAFIIKWQNGKRIN